MDNTGNPEEKKILKMIIAASEEFLQSAGSELNYQKITDTVADISGAKYAGFNLYEEDGSKFTTVGVSAPQEIMKKVSSLIGFKILGKVWENDLVSSQRIKSHATIHISKANEYAEGFVSKPIASLLTKTFNLSEVVFVKICKNDEIVGNFTLVMTQNTSLKNEEYIEIYTRQVGLLIARRRGEIKLMESETQLRNVFTAVSDPLFLFDQKTGDILDVNEAACKLYGYSYDKLLGLKASDLSAEPKATKKSMVNFTPFIPFRRHKKKDGTVFTVEVTASLFEYYDRKVIAASMRDITERKLAEETLRVERERFANIIEGTNAGTWEWDVKTGEIMINKRLAELIGYTLDELSGVNVDIWDKLYHPGDLKKADDLINKCFAKEIEHYICESRMKHKNGNWVWMKENGKVTSWTSDGKPLFVSGTHIDITELKQTEEEILHLSFHDHLTGLYNRRFFEEELKRLDTGRQLPLSFIMGDLNSLKIINDVFGHTAGDELLKETSEILKKVCRSDDILARWGGDEFVILLPKTTAADSEDIVQRIKKECEKTKIHKISVSLSLGCATKEKSAQDIQTIIIDAESNMYKNKLAQKESLASSIIFALDTALYEKSHETKEHTDRIKELATELGKSIELASHKLDELSLLASLHDIGKVAIPEKILLKKSKLTQKEWEVIKRHPEIGFNIAQSSPQISHIAKPILYCHENFDGSGYPHGIKGKKIPVVSRIILIIDAYDVMTTGRTYKEPMSKEDAIVELKRCAGSQFDPVLVEKFIEIISND